MMWNTLPCAPATGRTAAPATPRRSLIDLLAPLEALTRTSASLVRNPGAAFDLGGENCELPRYLFVGPHGGAATLRVGLFAALHGDEPEGAHAIVRFLSLLEASPEPALGYSLFVYPVCNPTGFEDRTRETRDGRDWEAELSAAEPGPEVRWLRSELAARSFHGLITLRTDAQATGFHAVAGGATLAKHLLRPVLDEVENLLPIDERALIDGFHARAGRVPDAGRSGFGAAKPGRPRPFEITLHMPRALPTYVQEMAFVLALRSILQEYRKLIAYAQDI